MDFATMLVFDSTCSKKNPSKALFPTNMAPVSDKPGSSRQCIQILGTLDMYPDFGYIAIFGLFQDKDSQGLVRGWEESLLFSVPPFRLDYVLPCRYLSSENKTERNWNRTHRTAYSGIERKNAGPTGWICRTAWEYSSSQPHELVRLGFPELKDVLPLTETRNGQWGSHLFKCWHNAGLFRFQQGTIQTSDSVRLVSLLLINFDRRTQDPSPEFDDQEFGIGGHCQSDCWRSQRGATVVEDGLFGF